MQLRFGTLPISDLAIGRKQMRRVTSATQDIDEFYSYGLHLSEIGVCKLNIAI